MRHLILVILTITCWAGEAQKLPADVQTVIDKAESAKVKIDQALIKDLTKLQETYTKKGNLDAATAIKEKIEATKKLIPDGLGEQAPLKVNLAGTWTIPSIGVFTLTDKLKASNSAGVQGKATVKGSSLVIVWDNGYTDTYAYPPKDGVMTGTNQAGLALVAKQTKEE